MLFCFGCTYAFLRSKRILYLAILSLAKENLDMVSISTSYKELLLSSDIFLQVTSGVTNSKILSGVMIRIFLNPVRKGVNIK